MMHVSLHPRDLILQVLVLLSGPRECELLRVTGHFQLGLEMLFKVLPLAWETPLRAPSVHHLMHGHLIKIG